MSFASLVFYYLDLAHRMEVHQMEQTAVVTEAEARARLCAAYAIILQADNDTADLSNVSEAQDKPAADPVASKRQNQGEFTT